MSDNVNHCSVDSVAIQRPLSVSKKVHPSFGEMEKNAKKIADEIRKVQKKPRKFRKWIRQTKSYKTCVTNWLINRKLDKEGREDLRPLFFIWTLTRACNFKCTYCDDHRGGVYPHLPKKGTLNTDEGIKLLDIMRTRASALYYAGGEPLLRRDLPQLMGHASKKGYFPQTINSNGSLIHNRLTDKNWDEFLSDIDIFIISLDAMDLEKLQNIYVYNRPENVIQNILALRLLAKEYDFKLMINCVVCQDTLEDAQEVLEFANKYDITFTAVPENYRARVVEGLLDNSKFKAFANNLLSRHNEGYKFAGSYRMNEKLLSGASYQCRNTIKPHIDFDGRLYWPCKATQNVDPEMINILDFKHVDDIWEHGRKIINPDKFHGQGKNQCGGNCCWAQNYATDCYAHGLKNPKDALKDIIDFAER